MLLSAEKRFSLFVNKQVLIIHGYTSNNFTGHPIMFYSYFEASIEVMAPSGVVLVVMFLWLSTAVSPPLYSTASTSKRIVSILSPINEALNFSTPEYFD